MKRRGADAKLRINGVALAAQSIDISGQVSDVMVTNTEGEPGNPDFATADVGGECAAAARIPDVADGTITVTQATFDDADGSNPFLAPFELVLGAYVEVEVDPSQLAPAGYRWDNAMVKSFSHRMMIPGGQPVTFTLVPDGLAAQLQMGA